MCPELARIVVAWATPPGNLKRARLAIIDAGEIAEIQR